MSRQQYLEAIEKVIVEHIRSKYSLPDEYSPDDEMPLCDCGIDDYFTFTFEVAELLSIDEAVTGYEADDSLCIDQLASSLAECDPEINQRD